MTTIRTVLSLGVLFVLFQPTNGQLAEQVGNLGDLKKLEIRGSTTFAPDNIKDPLWRSLDVQMAAHRKSLLRDYLVTLEEKVSEGYRYAGFWDVRVTAEVDRKAGRPVLTVIEGPRLTAGEIRVEGAKSIPVADLVRRLTSRTPSSRKDGASEPGRQVAGRDGQGLGELGKSEETDPPVWEQGKPVASIGNRKRPANRTSKTPWPISATCRRDSLTTWSAIRKERRFRWQSRFTMTECKRFWTKSKSPATRKTPARK